MANQYDIYAHKISTSIKYQLDWDISIKLSWDSMD